MTAIERLTFEMNEVAKIAEQVKRETGSSMAAQSALIAKWRGDRERYISFAEACTMEARNRFYGWGK